MQDWSAWLHVDSIPQSANSISKLYSGIALYFAIHQHTFVRSFSATYFCHVRNLTLSAAHAYHSDILLPAYLIHGGKFYFTTFFMLCRFYCTTHLFLPHFQMKLSLMVSAIFHFFSLYLFPVCILCKVSWRVFMRWYYYISIFWHGVPSVYSANWPWFQQVYLTLEV